MKFIRTFISIILLVVLMLELMVFVPTMFISKTLKSEPKVKEFVRSLNIDSQLKSYFQNGIINTLQIDYGNKLSFEDKKSISDSMVKDTNVSSISDSFVSDLYKWLNKDTLEDFSFSMATVDVSSWKLENKPESITLIKWTKNDDVSKFLYNGYQSLDNVWLYFVVIGLATTMLIVLVYPGNKFGGLAYSSLFALLGSGVSTLGMHGLKSLSDQFADNLVQNAKDQINKTIVSDYVDLNPTEFIYNIVKNSIDWISKNGVSYGLIYCYVFAGGFVIFLFMSILLKIILKRSSKVETKVVEKVVEKAPETSNLPIQNVSSQQTEVGNTEAISNIAAKEDAGIEKENTTTTISSNKVEDNNEEIPHNKEDSFSGEISFGDNNISTSDNNSNSES